MVTKWLAGAAALLTVSGCVSGYAKFYHGDPLATPSTIASAREGQPPAVPELARWADAPQAVTATYLAHGYLPIGYSSFNGKAGESEAGAFDQAKKVGADVVVVINPAYTGTQSTAIPIVTPTSQTSYTTANATAYGKGGPVTAYGSSQTTTYGTNTSFIPVSVDRYDFGAIYFVKVKSHLGVHIVDLTTVQRDEIQSNRGVMVESVVIGSPGFNADILVGDYLVAIDGESITDQRQAGELIKARWGQTTQIRIIRHGQVITKTVAILR